MPKKFIGEHFCAVFQKISGSENFMDKRGGISGFPFEIFLSHSAEKFLRGTLLCFTKLPVSKTVSDKRGCDSRFSIEKFFVSQCRESSSGNHLEFQSFWVSTIFMLQRVKSRFPVE